jgi:hypothetical protein
MALMSQRAYAAHRGVSHTAVQKAVQSGRISNLPDGRIDPALADQEWDRNTAYPDGDSGVSQYAKARAIFMHYKARLAKLEYEERVGSLLSKAEVQVAGFNTGRRIRDNMLNIPDRVVGAVAAEIGAAIAEAGLAPEMADRLDLAKVYSILAAEIRTGLQEFASEPADTGQ